jgi:hypothetical protein
VFPSRLLEPCIAAALSLLALLAACDESGSQYDDSAIPTSPTTDVAFEHAVRHYGVPVRVGQGLARTYIAMDRSGVAPLEIGVALSERAMEGLPAMTETDGHESMVVTLLALPVQNPTPYRFVELDWNPMGHEPAIVYGVRHFDFHFYTISRETRASIVPGNPRYAEAAASLPADQFRPPFYVDAATAAAAPAAAVTVPQMGLHWFDVRSPELQALLGNPAGYQPFTRTFIKGSWDGRFIFDEPMVTLDWLLARRISRDEAAPEDVIPVPQAGQFDPAGYYPQAYRIAYETSDHQFLVALTQLVRRD